jgi:catechol-2,3-dioxygenase
LQHYGLEIAGDMTTLRQLYGMLLNKGVEVVKITDHEIGNGVYFNDPDGNRMEFFLESEHDDERGKARFKAAGAPSRHFDLDPL